MNKQNLLRLTILAVLLSTLTLNLSAQTNEANTYLPVVSKPIASQTPTPPPAQTPTPSANHICSKNHYSCPDFSTQKEAQEIFDFCLAQGAGDIHRLDGDNDGIACENLPTFTTSKITLNTIVEER